VKAGSIASLERIRLGGIEQTVLLRGHDVQSPVLLFLHGGPGGSAMPLVHEFCSRLEEHFVVVHWDQRGAGKSWSPDIPRESMTIGQFVADCLELANHLRHRFGQQKIHLAGHSWGTHLAVLALLREPQLFHAYAAVAQVVNVRRAEAISLQFALDGARRAGDKAREQRLARLHPPCYDGSVEDLLFQRNCVARYGGSFFDRAVDKRLFRKYFESPEYSARDLLRLKKGSKLSLETIWRQHADWNALDEARSLEVPVTFLHGRCDRVTPVELVQEYFDALEAPRKKIVWFDRSGHCPSFEEPARFQQTLIDELLPVAGRA
jgi:pimeloyl-ACP methyl ester carboxylesterase